MLTTVCPDKLSCCFAIAERREIYFAWILKIHMIFVICAVNISENYRIDSSKRYV